MDDKMNLKETGMDGKKSIELAQDKEGRLFTW
jgi:hypothetical protein